MWTFGAFTVAIMVGVTISVVLFTLVELQIAPRWVSLVVVATMVSLGWVVFDNGYTATSSVSRQIALETAFLMWAISGVYVVVELRQYLKLRRGQRAGSDEQSQE